LFDVAHSSTEAKPGICRDKTPIEGALVRIGGEDGLQMIFFFYGTLSTVAELAYLL